jgi:uncharacterized protein
MTALLFAPRQALHRLGGLSALLCVLLVSLQSWALAVPQLQGRVNDHAGLLQAAERTALDERLAQFEKSTGHQFALLTVPNLDGDSVEDFSIRVAEAWKLGRAQQDDGLILLVAVQERKVRIEVGYGLEGTIPDAIAGRVIREVIAPAFRQGLHAQGIIQAFDVLAKAAAGEALPLPEPAARQAAKGAKREFPIFGILLVLGLFLGWFGRGRGGVGALLAAGALGGYRGGRGGGGGFRGGGGGFGGGGASGSW